MSTTQSHDVQPSLLPNPSPAEPVYVIRLRMRLNALTQENRQLKRDLAQVRRDLQACLHRMRKRTDSDVLCG